MSYKQVLNFDINRMGKQSGWCLQNCRLGFGINRGTFGSAIEDKNYQEAHGTLHPMSELPSNIAVPVYTTGHPTYGHIVVYDHGTWYQDGYRIDYPSGSIYGWGEFCDGQRVVQYVKEPSITKSIDDIAKEVIAGKWGNGEQRASALRNAGYSYTKVQNRVNEILSSQTTYYTIQYGDCLGLIAEKFGTTVDNLVSLNGIANPDIIYAGRTIRVK